MTSQPEPNQVLADEGVKLLVKGDWVMNGVWGARQYDRPCPFAPGNIRTICDLSFSPSQVTFIGRPDAEGWIKVADGVSYSPLLKDTPVQVRTFMNRIGSGSLPANKWSWPRVTSFRLSPPKDDETSPEGSVPTVQDAQPATPGEGWEAGADALVVALMPKLQKALTTAAERLYEEVLDTAEDYLKDNVRYNVQSAIDGANRQAQSDRLRLAKCDEHRQNLFWALKSLIAVARTEDAAGDLGARLMAAVDKAELALDAKQEEVSL